MRENLSSGTHRISMYQFPAKKIDYFIIALYWSIHWFRSRIAASPSLPTVRRRSTASASSSALASESSLGDTPPHARVGIDTRTVSAQSLAGTFVDIVVTLETDEIFHELNVHKRSTGETTDARTCMAAGVRCRPTA